MGDLDLGRVGVRSVINGGYGGYEDVDMTIGMVGMVGMVCMKSGQGCMIPVQEPT